MRRVFEPDSAARQHLRVRAGLLLAPQHGHHRPEFRQRYVGPQMNIQGLTGTAQPRPSSLDRLDQRAFRDLPPDSLGPGVGMLEDVDQYGVVAGGIWNDR